MDNTVKVNDMGRTLYIDPNPDGQEMINPEDLSILVELTTDSKSRSTITGGGNIKTSGFNGTVSFLDGSPLGTSGKRSLTTSYTEIGTTFSKPSDDSLEGFGMTDIDIGFNTSYAPLVKIKFVDIRAGALSRGTSSKYNVFFELPYPLFRLKVKGYYGKAVMYCLHMTKWNGEFNTKTGNFEIEAEFIGYTYAMLTDLLMGYLKAIPYTDIGSEKFELLKNKFKTTNADGTVNDPIMTIDEMLASISKFNEEIVKFKQTDPIYKKLVGINEANNILVDIKKLQSGFIKQAQISDSKRLVSDGQSWMAILDKGDKVKDLVKSYNDEVDKKIDELKKVVKSTSITKEKFHIIVTNFKNRIDTYAVLEQSDSYECSNKAGDDTIHAQNLQARFVSSIQDEKTKFNLYDLFNASKEYDRIIRKNRELEAQTKLDLSVKLRNTAKLNGNFNPSIRNIFRILTVHCEALLMTVQEVAKRAEDPANTIRLDALTKLGSNNLNVPNNSTIYAFPEFNDEFGEETYLGNRVSPNQVIEVAFIENLLEAFIKSKQNDITAETLRINSTIDWFALNPLDTKASQVGGLTTNPYKLGTTLHEDELLRKLMYRTFMYLGSGNNTVDKELLKYMAKLEANNMYYGTADMVLRDTIATNYTNADSVVNHFKTGSAKIVNYTGGTAAIPYMSEVNGEYVYTYITDNQTSKKNRAYIPVNGDWDGQGFYNGKGLKNNVDLKSLGNKTLFVGNYINGNTNTSKVDDGAKYLKILDHKEYLNYAFSLPLDSIIKLKEGYDKYSAPGTRPSQGDIEKGLKPDQPIAGLNPLDTKFAVTEFFEVKAGDGYPNSNLEKIKNDKGNSLLMPAFYTDSNTSSNTEDRTGTMLRRASNLVDVKSGTTSLTELSKLNVGENQSLINDALVTGTTGIVVDRIEFGFADKRGSGAEITTQSLFGSTLYYAQAASKVENHAKAFLFINTFPLVGMKTPVFTDISVQGRTILGALASNAGFVSAPTSWVYWIGSLLWRDRYFTDNNSYDPIITKIQYNGDTMSPVPTVNKWPTTKELWYANGVMSYPALKGPTLLLCGSGSTEPVTYRAIESTILRLPVQVKDEFINKFEAFVSSNWLTIKEGLEIYIAPVGQEIVVVGTNSDEAYMNDWVNTGRNNIINPALCTADSFLGENSFTGATLFNYHNATPKIFSYGKELKCGEYVKGIAPVWYDLNMDENAAINKRIVDLMIKRSVIMNYSPYTFRPNTTTGTTAPISINTEQAKTYLGLVVSEYEGLHKEFKTVVKDEQSIQNEIFKSTSQEAIKLNLYRHISALNNKWLGSNNDQNNLFLSCQISNPTRAISGSDGGRTPNLIDTFFFLSGAYTDIGDDFLLNPKVVSDMLTGNYNQSFFDYINRVLADNNFNFIPLPTFVNFKTIDGMKEIFTPYSYKDIARNSSDLSAGPSFVCVYAGQLSKHLDLGEDADYPDDGLDLSGRQGVSLKNIDYTLPPDIRTGGLSVPVFAVNYAQQNQNYFKDIKLDQKEFTETDESLHITDNISKSGDKNKSSYVGQNLFNVYQARAYSAEVEALGMPLIQPMMYFQLNNIPMFRGAYLIINTSHKIKPNHMTTKFKGVRVRNVKPPKLDTVFEITELLGELDGAESLAYSLDETVYDNNPKPVSGNTAIVYPDDALDDSTRNYYKLGYIQGRSFSNEYFGYKSNTSRNGEFLTYTEVLSEVSKITKVPLIVLKTMAVIESSVGQNATVKEGAPNASGFLGLMQFGRPAAVDVKKQIEDRVFDLGLTFGAATNASQRKLIIPPDVNRGQWSKFKNVNTKLKNSMYDDFISALGGAYYAIQNLRVGDPSTITTKNIVDIYLSHQQGRGGYSTIKANPTESLCDPQNGKLVGTANNMKNNSPIKELNPRGNLKCGTAVADKIVFKQWVAAWQGIIDMIINQIEPTYQTSNADKLRRVLAELGYIEKTNNGKLELDSSGRDITSGIADVSAAILRTVKAKIPNMAVVITSGNDVFHQGLNYASRHKDGSAVDFAISPVTSANVAKVLKILQGYAVGNNDKFRFKDEYTTPSGAATGGHFHMSWRDSGGGTDGNTELATAISLAQSNSGFQTYTV
tara:strand:+ start:2409 stop:8687 length:6279 start_codon:yes stop_codon:yes gene_type:complete